MTTNDRRDIVRFPAQCPDCGSEVQRFCFEDMTLDWVCLGKEISRPLRFLHLLLRYALLSVIILFGLSVVVLPVIDVAIVAGVAPAIFGLGGGTLLFAAYCAFKDSAIPQCRYRN
jgi:hypothetical protein